MNNLCTSCEPLIVRGALVHEANCPNTIPPPKRPAMTDKVICAACGVIHSPDCAWHAQYRNDPTVPGYVIPACSTDKVISQDIPLGPHVVYCGSCRTQMKYKPLHIFCPKCSPPISQQAARALLEAARQAQGTLRGIMDFDEAMDFLCREDVFGGEWREGTEIVECELRSSIAACEKGEGDNESGQQD